MLGKRKKRNAANSGTGVVEEQALEAVGVIEDEVNESTRAVRAVRKVRQKRE